MEKLTKGEIFKKENGMSRTMAQNIKNNNVGGVEEYRLLRKEKRKKQQSVIKAKKDKVRAGRKVKVTTVKKIKAPKKDKRR